MILGGWPCRRAAGVCDRPGGRTGSRSPGDSGYSSWTERPDGTVVIVDYTTGNPPAAVPFARAYLTTEEFLMGTASAGGR